MIVIGCSMHARRSRPAEPGVAYRGRWSRTRASRTLTSSFFIRARLGRRETSGFSPFVRVIELCDMVDELSREHGFRRPRQGMQPVVVEQRELVVVGADCVLREIRGEQRQFFP